MTARVGIVGLGRQGLKHLHALRSGGFEVSHYFDPTRRHEAELETGVRWLSSLDELCAPDTRITIVVVATPTGSHDQPIRTALAAGKHVIVEKPATSGLRSLNDLLSLGEETGAWICCNFSRRWDPHMAQFSRQTQDLGEPIDLLIDYSDGYQGQDLASTRAAWKLRGPGAGILSDWGPHLIDQALEVFAERGAPSSVQAWSASPLGFVAEPHGETVSIRIQWSDGSSANLLASWLSFHTGVRMKLDATDGTLVTNGSHYSIATRRRPTTLEANSLTGPLPPGEPRSVSDLLRGLLRSASERAEEQARLRLVTEILDLANTSIATGMNLALGSPVEQ